MRLQTIQKASFCTGFQQRWGQSPSAETISGFWGTRGTLFSETRDILGFPTVYLPSGYDVHSLPWKIPTINGAFNGKIIYKWAIFHGYVK